MKTESFLLLKITKIEINYQRFITKSLNWKEQKYRNE